MSPFPCTQCGACCQHVNASEITKHLDRGDGCCQYFDTKTRQCRIYETRPLFCRIDEGYAQYGQVLRMDRQTYYRVNLAVCIQLQEAAGLPVHFRPQWQD